jgi:hypothetical protein
MQSLEDIPSWFSEYMNISLEAAQVILSIVVIMAVLLPTMYLSRGTRALTVEIIMLFLTECFLVGIGWLPFWILIATVAVMSMAIALLGTRVVVGG